MLLILEGIVMCFILLLVCVAGIAKDGPVGLVCFFEDDVQERVVELGLTTREKIKRSTIVVGALVTIPIFVGIPLLVYGVNGASGFWDGFIQMLIIGIIANLFDRIFIDWWWVGHTRAWDIPGTEDFKPYIPTKALVRKWMGTLVATPLVFALIAWIMA